MSNSTISIGKTSHGLTIGGTGAMGGSGNHASFNLGDLSIGNTNGLDHMFDNSELTFSIIKANGGYVVRCGNGNHSPGSVYIIPESKKNFDRELGKIISMHLLKG